jgi:hypothetical protein
LDNWKRKFFGFIN